MLKANLEERRFCITTHWVVCNQLHQKAKNIKSTVHCPFWWGRHTLPKPHDKEWKCTENNYHASLPIDIRTIDIRTSFLQEKILNLQRELQGILEDMYTRKGMEMATKWRPFGKQMFCEWKCQVHSHIDSYFTHLTPSVFSRIFCWFRMWWCQRTLCYVCNFCTISLYFWVKTSMKNPLNWVKFVKSPTQKILHLLVELAVKEMFWNNSLWKKQITLQTAQCPFNMNNSIFYLLCFCTTKTLVCPKEMIEKKIWWKIPWRKWIQRSWQSYWINQDIFLNFSKSCLQFLCFLYRKDPTSLGYDVGSLGWDPCTFCFTRTMFSVLCQAGPLSVPHFVHISMCSCQKYCCTFLVYSFQPSKIWNARHPPWSFS